MAASTASAEFFCAVRKEQVKSRRTPQETRVHLVTDDLSHSSRVPIRDRRAVAARQRTVPAPAFKEKKFYFLRQGAGSGFSLRRFVILGIHDEATAHSLAFALGEKIGLIAQGEA